MFGDDPRSHRFVHLLRRHGFSARDVYSHLELSRFDSPHFPRRGSRPTHSNGGGGVKDCEDFLESYD
jgi:hypothetical protein